MENQQGAKMYEAHATIVGKVISDPIKRTTPGGDEVLSFRMASNARRQDRATGEWVDSATLYLTVTCWRRLVTGVGASVMRGDPVIAYGQLRTNEYTTRDGAERADLEMRASAVGPDLARCIVKVERPRQQNQNAVTALAGPTDGEPTNSVVGESADAPPEPVAV